MKDNNPLRNILMVIIRIPKKELNWEIKFNYIEGIEDMVKSYLLSIQKNIYIDIFFNVDKFNTYIYLINILTSS